MKNRVGWYFRAKRRAHDLSVEALAARVGYRNIRKGAHRIVRLELDGGCPDVLLIKLADVLGVNYETVLCLVERDSLHNISQKET